MKKEKIENCMMDALRREGKPMDAEALLSLTDEKQAAADALSGMLYDGRLLLTRKKKIALPEQTGLIYGKIQGNARGYGFLIPEDGSADMFVSADAMHGAMHGDTVWVRGTDQLSRNGTPEAEVALVARRANTSIVGTFETDERFGGFVVPDETRLYMDMTVRPEDTGKARTGDKVVAEITAYPDGRRPLTGKVCEILGNKRDAGTDMLSIIRRLELPDTFDKAALRMAKALPRRVDEDAAARREDLRNVLTITIDGADARDLDDAVSLRQLNNGNYLLGVHIADVSEYVRAGSALDKEAYRRGTSVYFPDRVLPMFPTELSNGICSLNEGEDKQTLSCIMEINAGGTVISHRIAETVIRSAHRMTYDDINAIFAGDAVLAEKYSDIVPMLTQMRALTEALNALRVKRGSIDFDLAEAAITLDAAGKPVDVSVHERGVSNRMIEEFMLAANETVAAHMRDLRLPLMYRVHEKPDDEKLTALNVFLNTMGYGIKNIADVKPITIQRVLQRAKGTKEENVVSRVTLRSLKKARYSDECMGHFGLATDKYCHFTSPIRRYPDLTVHRLVKAALHGELDEKRAEKWRSELPVMAKHCSEREQKAAEAERTADDLKKCEYMRGHIGETYTAIISGVMQYGFFAALSNTVEGMVRTASINDDYYVCDEKHYRMVGRASKRVFRLGDEVRVRVAAVDTESVRIDFELFDSKTSGTRKPETKNSGAKSAGGQTKGKPHGGSGGRNPRRLKS